MRSDPPLLLRPTYPQHSPGLLRYWAYGADRGNRPAWIALVAGAAGPVGGDRFRLTVDVGPGAALVLRALAATLALPGPHGEPSHSYVQIRVAERGTLAWLPGALIAAHGCRHHATTHIELEPGARLLAREGLILGRHGEPPGTAHQRLRVCIGDQPIHDQELCVGPNEPGSDGPAVTGGHRAVGSLFLVGPDRVRETQRPPGRAADDVAVMPLDGPATLVAALGPDTHSLRRRLDTAALALLQNAAADTAGDRDASPAMRATTPATRGPATTNVNASGGSDGPR